MRTLVLTRYERLGSPSRLRFYQYLPDLEADGITFHIDALLDDDYLRRLYGGGKSRRGAILAAYARRLRLLWNSRAFDLVWIEKEIFPYLPAWGERLLNRLGVPYVVDYDDAVFHQYDAHRSGAVRRLLGNKIDEVMRRSALVISGNDYIAARACRAGAKRVERLPTVVDTRRYSVPEKKTSGNDPFTIGWVGTPLTAGYLPAVGPALAEVCAGGAARVVLVGAGEGAQNIPAEVRPWSEETEAAEIGRFDVGIMPLPNAPFERGKCGYKLIQYMACGRPVVASPVGVNGEIVREGENGFLATTAEDWSRALRALRDDPDLRARLGRAARARVESEYSLQVTAPRLREMLRSVSER